MRKVNIFNRRYLGSKQKLIPFIQECIEKECGKIDSIIDIFAGTGVVAYSFIDKCKVIVNDILNFNYFSYFLWFRKNDLDLNKLSNLINSYNNRNNFDENYFSLNFANTYFSYNDTKKIGYIRENIENLFIKKKINLYEKYYLITALIYSADRIANTVGHYDAYRKIKNIEDRFIMYELELPNNIQFDTNEIYNEDANTLISKISGDLLYIDPPYNSRQYCDAYHLLENLANWEKPEVFGVAKKMARDESIKSLYCTKKARDSFADLIDKAKVKYIVVSYNNMYDKGVGRSQSILKDYDIVSILSQKGKVVVYEKDFNCFTTGKTHITDHKERLYICHVNQKNDPKIEDKQELGFVKSPLNYTGGKFKIIRDLLEIFPKKINTFVDLFCGGANVSANIQAEKIYSYDSFNPLITVLNFIKNETYFSLNEKIESVINRFDLSYSYKNGYEYYGCSSSNGLGQYNKNGYARLREYYSICNIEEKPLILLVLIIYGFNNQIRFSKKGNFNIPVGKRDYNNAIKKNLNKFIQSLKTKNITFINSDFRKLDIEMLDKEDFVYLDPPYLLGCATYNESNGWTEKDELDMYDLLLKLDRKNIKFALSNVIEHKGQVHRLLNDFAITNHFNINFVNRSYDNASYHIKDKGKNQTVEVVITNYNSNNKAEI